MPPFKHPRTSSQLVNLIDEHQVVQVFSKFVIEYLKHPRTPSQLVNLIDEHQVVKIFSKFEIENFKHPRTSSQLVNLIDEHQWVGGAHALQTLHHLARHCTHVRAPVCR